MRNFATLIVVGVIFWAVMAPIAYSYSQNPYKWPKKWGVLFALGGPITAMGAIVDVWMHTSMMGSYTRDWGKDPNTHVITWRELEGKPPRSKARNRLLGLATWISMYAQIYGTIVLIRVFEGHGSQPIIGALCGVYVLVCVAIVLADAIILYTNISRPNVTDRMFLFRDGVGEVLMVPMLLGIILFIPAMLYRIHKGY